jgi:predicted esterase
MGPSFPRVAAIALVALPCAVAGTYLVRSWATRGAAEASVILEPSPVEPVEAVADWCAPGFAAVPGGCLASPDGVAARAVVVYLHGRYARDAVADEVDRQRRLAERATRKGYAVLATRSRLGVCSASELTDWYCWPTSEAAADGEAVRRWTKVVDDTQRRLGATRRYLLGFSSGGYFAGLVASHGWATFDAVAVAHGGPVEPVQSAGAAPPMLLLSADDDVAQLDMLRFDADLRRVGWPHDAYARDGAHGLADVDIDAALAFFARSGESMPLRPPLSALHRAVFHVRDAGAESGAADDDASTPPASTTPLVPSTPDDASDSSPPADE